jgi:biotin carboxyl carrier protein
MENDLLTPNGAKAQPVVVSQPRKRPSNLWLIIVAALFIIVPFLTWYFTWFGRSLSDEKIAEYLVDEKHPRNIQHALSQIEARMEKKDASVKKFYPRIVELTKNSNVEVRKTVAWVMGQDNTSEEFHRGLLSLLSDNEPLVRRNAALQLVRFAVNGQPDASGRPELRAMLRPFEAKSPIAGTLVSILPVGSEVHAGSLLARIRDASGNTQEFRSAVDGKITTPVVAKEGDTITANQTIAWLAPDHMTILASLRALAYVGTSDDLPLVESIAQMDARPETASEASATAKAIHSRFR